MFRCIFNGNQRPSRRVRDYYLDLPFKNKLCMAFVVVPLSRCIASFLMGAILLCNFLETKEPTEFLMVNSSPSETWMWNWIWGNMPKVDYRIGGTVLHLAFIFPLSALNLRSAYKVYKMPRWQMPLGILERQFVYACMWITYCVLGIILSFLCSQSFPYILFTMIPEFGLDVFGFLYTGQMMRAVNELREIALAIGRTESPPVFSMDSDFMSVVCRYTCTCKCEKEDFHDDVTA